MGYGKSPHWKRLWAMEITGCAAVVAVLYLIGKVFDV